MNTVRFVARRGWFLTAFLGMGVFHLAAKNNQADVRWNELAPLIVGHHVVIPLPGGVTVQGEVLSVRDDALPLDIRKTTDAQRFPKGQVLIPRTAVSEIWVTEHRGAGGRILGPLIGALLGVVAGAEAAVHGTHSEAAGVLTFTAITVASTVAGYFAGRGIDRHTRRLRIAPEPAGSNTESPNGGLVHVHAVHS